MPISRPELHRALRRAGRDRRADLRGRAPPARTVVRLVVPVRHDRRAVAARQPARLPAQPRGAARPTSRKRRRCGTSTTGRRSPRPRWRTANGRARTTSWRSTAPTATVTIEIDTTRPELVAACVALVAHPDDERYQPLFGSTVRTPLYGVEVPVVAHELAQPDKGTGIAMICTFGDTTDVTWWRELALADAADHRPRRADPADPPPGVAGRAVRRDRRADRRAGPEAGRRAAGVVR